MWVVIKEKFIRTGPLVAGGRSQGKKEWVIDRVVESLTDDVKSGEVFFKCNTKV